MGRRTLLLIASILVAALGTALIWLYVQGADTRAAASTTQVPVLVAVSTVKAGQPASQVKPQQRLLPQTVVDGLAGALLTDPGQIKGFTRTDVVAGLPLLRDQFSSDALAAAPSLDGLPANMVAMQVTLPDPQRLAGLLQAGSQIRVYAGLQNKDNEKEKYAAVLFKRVTVLQAGLPTNATTPAPANPGTATTGTGTTGGAGTAAVPQAIVTLALTNDQAKNLVFAQSSTGGSAALWFGLLGPNVQQDDGTTVDRVRPGAL
jgi:pilus assembly protein CpaB